MAAYSYLAEAWKRPDEGIVRALRTTRLVQWRRGPSVAKLDHPTRINRARSLGYKAKQGVITARIRIHRGPMNVERPKIRKAP